MNDEHKRIINTFEEYGIKFTDRQKEICAEAYDKAKDKIKCINCDEEPTFRIFNIRKDEVLYFFSSR